MAMSMYFKIQETEVYRTLSAACLPLMAYRGGDDDDDRPSSCIARFWWWRMENGEQRENCMSMSAMGQKTATDYFVQNMQRWG